MFIFLIFWNGISVFGRKGTCVTIILSLSTVGALGLPVLSSYYLLHDLVPLHPPSFSCFLQDLGQVSIWKGGVFAHLSKCEHLGGNTAACTALTLWDGDLTPLPSSAYFSTVDCKQPLSGKQILCHVLHIHVNWNSDTGHSLFWERAKEFNCPWNLEAKVKI